MVLGPVVALLTQSLYHGHSYTPASYVKWLEMAGGRVMLVPYDAAIEDVDAIFNQTNGVLFIGGGSAVPDAARRFYANTVAAHARGDIYPIWGTCDGFEWLMQIAAEDDAILANGFDSENISLPLNLTAAAPHSALLADAASIPIQGSIWRTDSAGAAPTTLLSALGTLPLTLNNHVNGVTPQDFARSKPLSSSFEVLATNRDRKGREFVSVVEGKHGLPVWATQWHPEKNIFEQARAPGHWWPFEAIAHTRSAVAVSQYLANYFVDACRASTHRFADATEEWRHLVYHQRTSTAMAPGFVQVYILRGAAEEIEQAEEALP